MEINVVDCVAWSGNLQTREQWSAWANGELEYQSSDDLPALKEIPAMQRRRLSSYAKITLDCILKAGSGHLSSVPCVFASRHGDLHKTAKLIEDVADKEGLSPTHFGLSVHNAVAGLFSIYSKNKQPMTAIAAGEDSFMMALLDAYAKLNSGKYENILLVYSDEIVPEKYQEFVSKEEKNVAIAMLLSKEQTNNSFNFLFEAQNNYDGSCNFQPFDFLNFYFGSQKESQLNTQKYRWVLNK